MDVKQEVMELAEPLADELGFEVVDVDCVPSRGRLTVRVFLDRPGGITLDDCARMSRRLGDLLEMNQTVPHAYVIEVSSPGIERRLRTEEHFQRFLGERARVEAYGLVDGRRRAVGEIRAVTDGAVTLAIEPERDWTVPLREVRQAHLVVDPWQGAGDGARKSPPTRRQRRRARQGG